MPWCPFQAAYDSAASAQSGLAAFFTSSPTPNALATSLSTSTASSLALPPSTSTISSNLATQAAALNGAQFNSAGGDATALKNWVMATKAVITSAVGAFDSAKTAHDTYLTSPNNANYDTMVAAANTYRAAAATNTLRNQWDQQDSSPSAATNYKTPAVGPASAAAAAAAALVPFVATAQGAVATVPALGGYAAALGGLTLPAATVRSSISRVCAWLFGGG
jgi:hypothetical protein